MYVLSVNISLTLSIFEAPIKRCCRASTTSSIVRLAGHRPFRSLLPHLGGRPWEIAVTAQQDGEY